MTIHDRLGTLAAWAATMPARRFFFKRKALRDVEITSEDGIVLRGWLAEVPDARGTVLVGHGYRDDRRQMLALVPALAALGLRTLLIDFRAHGRSGGTRITIGIEEARDVRASLGWARELGGPVSYLGFSMGAAAYLLSGVEAHCAVLDSPYDTLSHAIAVRGAFIRAPSALLDAFRRAKEERCELVVEDIRPVDAVAALARPTLLVFARGDAWVGREAREHYRSTMSSSCELLEVEGGHDSHFDTGWMVHVTRFFERHTPVP
jgi:pimeloyl-ACP methyl ester carboxylesterase